MTQLIIPRDVLAKVRELIPPGAGDVEVYANNLGFVNVSSAVRCLARLVDDDKKKKAFSSFAPHLFSELPSSGDPDWVLSAFERFLHRSRDHQAMYNYLASNPRAVEMLLRIFSASRFLGEILIRNPEYINILLDKRSLSKPRSGDQIYHDLSSEVAKIQSPEEKLDFLRRFQRLELLRIGACDLFDLFDMPTATAQLSNLADSLIRICLDMTAFQLREDPLALVVIGMGKLGGQELNYSSDIDFIFIAKEPSSGVIRLAERLIDSLARITTEGFLYRVDMRLRPWGKGGPLVSSPGGFYQYLSRNALNWEKQALIKARPIAGDIAIGEKFLSMVRPLLFDESEQTIRADVYALKKRTEEYALQKASGGSDVKLGEGSIRDVEFTVQFLQLIHGKHLPDIVSPNTLVGLHRCLDAGVLTAEEFQVLADGYIFLRTIEHHLQMMDYRQTHILPADPNAIRSLAYRLGYSGVRAGDEFLNRYRKKSAAIREIYLRHVGRVEMDDLESRSKKTTRINLSQTQPSEVSQHIARMSPSYRERFSEKEIAYHASLVGNLTDTRLAVLDALPQPDGFWKVTIVAVDFPGELSLICGLLFVYGLDISKGDVFTYEAAVPSSPLIDRRKIVDVFSVRSARATQVDQDIWPQLEADLNKLLEMVRLGQRREARSELTKRVGTSLFEISQTGQGEVVGRLYPIEITIDNESSDQYTLLRIDTLDTVGFLYEFTNALAIEQIYIARVIIDSVGNRVSDILYVTDENGRKIIDPDRLLEMRVSTVLVKHFTHLLPLSPNPESALFHFREFLVQLFKRPNWPNELNSLERPEVLQAIARLLGVSDFLWDDFLRMQYANLFPVVTSVDSLSSVKSRKQLENELAEILLRVHSGPQPPAEDAPWREAVNSFKDREMFRIDMRHILGHTSEFWEFSAELSDLAEVIINVVYHLCHEDLRSVYGSPLLVNGDISEMAVLALGKCGGRELGFASDIELMFVYSGNGTTSGPQEISTAEFYEKLVQDFVRTIRAKREGIFEIDLQLRPYGKAGSLAVSLDSFNKYFSIGGPAWPYERQALVKLRPVAGNAGLGEKIVELRDAYVYSGEPYDVTSMRAMRERQLRHLVVGGVFNLKYSPGGLVDIEYLVQGLQMNHGREHPELRLPNTRDAMAALAGLGILSESDYNRLRKAHTFLRWMIDSLRVVRGNARDVTLPQEGTEEYAYMARRLRFGGDIDRLRSELIRYTTDVIEINRRLLQ